MGPAKQLEQFLAKFTPGIAADARAAFEFLHMRLPTATRLVYDNYNALVMGFGSSDKASDAILSIAVYPRYCSLFFLRGAALDDPERLLEGKGSKVRHIKLIPPDRLVAPAVIRLVDQAAAQGSLPMEGSGALVIKSISARQRPRRPA